MNINHITLRKHIAISALCLFLVNAFAQKESTIVLERADVLSFDKMQNADCQVLQGNVVFRHDKSHMYCDSAYFYSKSNNIEAFGHIRMQQGDTLFVFGDRLHYDGNTRMARLKGNVRMINRETTLETDSLDYDRNQSKGYYYTGGRIYDKKNVLTSTWGEYCPKTKMAEFRDKVRLVNEKFGLGSDYLKYNTGTKTAYIVGPSIILYKNKTTIYSEDGWYDTKNERSKLLKNSYVEQTDGKKLKGDTIYYDKRLGQGNAHGHVQMIDSVRKVTVYGKTGFFREKDSYAVVRDSAYAIEYSNLKDTLFLHADTLKTFADSTFHVIKAISSVRFYRSDIQGKCDTLIYSNRDSLLSMYRDPVLWSDSLQLNGNFIQVHQRDSFPDWLYVKGWSLAVQQVDSMRYNQIYGKSLKAYFKKKEVYKIVVEGNAESAYYPKEDNGNIIGLNRAESSNLIAYIENRKIQRIVFLPNPSGVLYPDNQIPNDKKQLSQFAWLDNLRPKNKSDIFKRFVLDQNEKKGRKRRK